MATLKYNVHIDMQQNELQNVTMQTLSSDPSGFEGHLYYNSSSNILKFHNGTEYVSLSSASGDITGVTAGNGLTGGGTSGGVTLTVGAGDGITVNSGDVAVTAAQTTITSVLNSSLVVGRDAHNQIKFSTDDQIIFRVGNADGVTFKASGEIEATSLDISGDADIDGTLEADAITIGGTSLADTITGTTVTNSTNAAHVLITDNESTDEENQVTFIEGAGGGGANRGLEADGDFTYNPSSGTVTATIFKGNIDAVDGDFDGTLEADAITIGGTALNTVIAGVTVANATTAAVATTVTITDNENTNEENALVFTAGADIDGGNLGLESDGNATYNPSTGTITASVFKGNIDAVNGDFDGTMEADAISINGTTITATAAELNILDGVTSTASELNILDGVTSTTAELNLLDGSTAGTVVASKAVVVDSNKDISSFRNVTLGGTLTAETLDIGGNVDVDGTLETDALTVGGTNILTGGIVTTLGTIAQDTILFQSSAGDDPLLTLENTANDATGARIQLLKDRGAAPGDGDELGEIIFSGDDSGQAQTNYVKLRGLTADVTDGAEGGKFEIRVATHDGEMQPGLIIQDGNAEDEIDVTIGSGSGSVTTIAGDLTVSGTTTTVNSTTVNLNDHNIVLDSGNSTSAVVNGAGITIEGGSGDDATFTYNTTGPKFELKLGSSHEDLQVAQLIASSLDISGNVDVDGSLETDALSINGTTVSSTAAELNLVDGSSAGTIVNSKGVIYGSSGEVNATTLQIGGTSITSTAAELNLLDTSEAGTVVNSKAVIYDGNGVVHASGFTIGSAAISETELEILDGATVTTAELNLIDGGTSRGTTAVANGDGFLHNDGGTMRMTNVSKLADLFAGTNISASSSVLSVANASTSAKGVVELATDAESLAGSSSSLAVTPSGLAARSFKATIGDGSDVDIAVTHSLGTRDVIVQVYDASSYETIICEVVRTDANTVTINTNAAIGNNDGIVLITKID